MSETFNPFSGQAGLPYVKFFIINPGTPYTDLPRAIYADGDGAISFIDVYGTIIANFPLRIGHNPISPASVLAITGASNVWGVC